MKDEYNRISTTTVAVIYCRVSSTKQRLEGSGLESQEQRCRAYANEKGYAVEAVFPDDVSGGGDFMHRPGMVALLATFAIATHNRVLGAALVSVIDAMPARNRPFSAQELADKLCGDETRAVLASVEAIRTANQKALNANRAFLRGRADPLAAVKLALRNKKETT